MVEGRFDEAMRFGNLTVGEERASVAYSRHRRDGTYQIIPLAAEDEAVLRKLLEGGSTVNLGGEDRNLILQVLKWEMGPFPSLVCEEAD